MTRSLCLSIEADFAPAALRYGFSCAMGLYLAEALGGLWHVSEQGCGMELMAPHRHCVITNWTQCADDFGRDGRFEAAMFYLSISTSESAGSVQDGVLSIDSASFGWKGVLRGQH